MDKNDTLGARIARLRKQAGLNQRNLAEACGWASQSRVGNYEKNTRLPSIDDLKLIAAALNVTLAELAGDDAAGEPDLERASVTNIKDLRIGEDRRRYSSVQHIGMAREGVVPVVGIAKLGIDGFFEELDFPVGHGDGYLLIRSDDPNAYGLRVVGDSMHPRIKNGEYVLVEPNKPFHSGDEVMVKTADGQAMIKEFLYLRDGMYRFDSVNQSHPPIHIAQDQVLRIHLVGGILKSSRFTHD